VSAQLGVTGRFSASHRDPLNGALHGHDYVVTAWFDASLYRDGRVHEVGLHEVLKAHFDHRELPAELHSMEAIRNRLLQLVPNVDDIDIERPVIGFKLRGRP
jgi:6-pyruvoyl-tetrahydropterin synthase